MTLLNFKKPDKFTISYRNHTGGYINFEVEYNEILEFSVSGNLSDENIKYLKELGYNIDDYNKLIE